MLEWLEQYCAAYVEPYGFKFKAAPHDGEMWFSFWRNGVELYHTGDSEDAFGFASGVRQGYIAAEQLARECGVDAALMDERGRK